MVGLSVGSSDSGRGSGAEGVLFNSLSVSADYPNALVDSLITCANVREAEETGAVGPEGLAVVGKCINPATGEPVSARREEFAVLPVEGSRDESVDGHGRGRCPHCGARVALSKKGFITAHSMKNVPIPAPDPTVRLAERQAEVTESGARVGSPDAAQRVRGAELAGGVLREWNPPLVWNENVPTVHIRVRKPRLNEDGTPMLGKKGQPLHTSEMEEFPATADNIRTALRQEQARKPRKCKKTGEMIGGPDKAKLAKLGAMLRGATGLDSVGVIGAEPGTFKVREACTWAESGEGAGSNRDVSARVAGVADPRVPTLSNRVPMVQGRSMRAEEPKRVGKNGKPRNAAGWSGSVGRPRPDRIAVDGSDPAACVGKGCTIAGCVGVVGERGYGVTTCAEFRTWSASHRKRFWKDISAAKRYAKRASDWVMEHRGPDSPARPDAWARAEAKRLREKGESLPACGW